MANNAKVRSAIKDFLERLKAHDSAIPEDVAEDALEMVENVNDALCEDEEADPLEITKDACKDEEELETKIEDTMVNVLKKYGVIKDRSSSTLDKFINSIGCKDEDIEEEVETEDEEIEEVEVKDSAEELKRKLRKVKPVIASIKDESVRRKLTDSLIEIAKLAKGDSYGDIASIANSASKSKMKDTATRSMPSDFDLGMQWAQSMNPHYKKEDK